MISRSYTDTVGKLLIMSVFNHYELQNVNVSVVGLLVGAVQKILIHLVALIMIVFMLKY